ncbi:MAG: 4Fe-4S dicluster domain-containing protein [Acidobacteria bacterium]|nr:4Fe-4S dicluster domain-containing protein [Acidobacteriota bacterium]
MQYAKLIDISKCVGCRACEVACKEWNETGIDDPKEHPFGYQSHEDLTYRTWNVVKFFELGNKKSDLIVNKTDQFNENLETDHTKDKLLFQYDALLGPEPGNLIETNLGSESELESEEINYSVWQVTKFFNQNTNITNQHEIPKWMFRKHGCMHCTEAACIKACPVDALTRNNELGYVRLNVSTCTGCGYCVDACPFDVPKLDSGAIWGFGKVSKCRLCSDRIQHNKQPACVQSCPPNALEFGLRSEMVKLGQNRIDDLKERGYKDAYLYGENELGGLNVLTVLPSKPKDFDLPENPKVPEYLNTWKKVVQPLGVLAIAGTALMLGFSFVNNLLQGSKKGDSH